MNKGVYCLVILLEKNCWVSIGKKWLVYFRKGHYCYVGSALNNLEKRIKRHKGKEKRMKWHIDYFLQAGKVLDVKTIETGKKMECILSRNIEKIADYRVSGFGCSDCACHSHLYFFKKNPLKNKSFLGIFSK